MNYDTNPQLPTRLLTNEFPPTRGESSTRLRAAGNEPNAALLAWVASGRCRVHERVLRSVDPPRSKALPARLPVELSVYEPTVSDNLIIYDVYMPLKHEKALQLTLDQLFYKDTVLAQLECIGVDELEQHFERQTNDTDGTFLSRVAGFVESRFGGYSRCHVSGRFRGGALLTSIEAAQRVAAGERYLDDETTAVVRFIFRGESEEVDQVRYLFGALVMKPLTSRVSGEDEVWVLESGSCNRLHVWEQKRRGRDSIGPAPGAALIGRVLASWGADPLVEWIVRSSCVRLTSPAKASNN